MDEAHRVHPFQHLLQGILDLGVRDAHGLQHQHRADHLQVVLHPVIDLMQEQRAAIEGGLELRRPQFDLTFEFILQVERIEFVLLAVGGIELRGEEILHDPLRVRDRTDVEAVPEGCAVLLVVQDVDVDVLAGRNRLTDRSDRHGIGFGSLQEPAVPAIDLVPGITRQLQKGVVGEDDRIVGQVRVGHHNRHTGRPDCRRKRVGLTSRKMKIIGQRPGIGQLHCVLQTDSV